jgi:hypothetical protein
MNTPELALREIPKQTLKFDIPALPDDTSQSQVSATKSYNSIEHAISAIFPTPAVEKKLTKTRSLLGEASHSLSNEQVECLISEFQFLVDTWLDEFEQDVFGGKTLKEVLNEE